MRVRPTLRRRCSVLQSDVFSCRTSTPLKKRFVIATDALKRGWIACACLPLVLLSGCPSDAPGTAPAGSPASASSRQTAPALTPAPGGSGAARPVPGRTPPQSATAAQNGSAAGPNAQPDARTQQLITKVEGSYNSGVANYRAGRLDAARLDFDFAVDTMLTSGLDLKAEGAAADEFDRLLNSINSLEMAALKQGNGFSPKIEEAPLEAANDTTFAPNPELVAKLKSELNVTSDLPLVINDQVAGYIGVFSNSTNFRNHMAASLRRLGKYKDMIQKILAEEGVPQDLIYLAVAESGFQSQVVNARSGAGGMWQFMASSGNDWGLTRNGYYDYRFDPEKAARGYARYIKSLYKQFGDWYLAMAAYDWGPLYVQRAVQRTGFADFWELYRRNAMPAETRAYVPQILAAILMAKNPERYGLDKVVPDPPVLYDTVPVSYAIDLHLVADVTESTVPEIVALNPALLRLSTPRDISFDLHIPAGTKDLFTDRLKDIPQDRRSSWRFHIVKPGESLEAIATSLHARPAEIAETNGITAQDPMSAGDELVVPVEAVNVANSPSRYVPRRGDTLVMVADRFNVSTEDLRRWNGLTSSNLRTGRTLWVTEPVRLAPSSRLRGRRTGVALSHSRDYGAAALRGSTRSRHRGSQSASRPSAARLSAKTSSSAAKAPARSKRRAAR